MSKDVPDAPDYAAAAREQAASSREVTDAQTWANRPNQNTPFGSQTWTANSQIDPSTGQRYNAWTQNTTLDPRLQSALDAQIAVQQGRSDMAVDALGRSQSEFSQPLDWSSLPEGATAPQAGQYGQGLQPFAMGPNAQQVNPEQMQRNLSTDGLQGVDSSQKYYGNAGDAIYKQFSDRNEPQFAQEQDRIRTQLYNAGLKEGDAAYEDQMTKLSQRQNDARQQASYQATIGAGAEAQRMQGMDSSLREQQFGERSAQGNFANQAASGQFQQNLGAASNNFSQQLQAGTFSDAQRSQAAQQQLAFGGQQFNEQLNQANFQNQNRQQAIAELMTQRGFSLNEINAILNGQQVSTPQMPSFNTAQRSEGLQSLQATNMQHQANMDVFSAQQQANQSMMQGAGSLASGFMMSDRRLKKNIRPLTKLGDIQIYSYDYVWGEPGIGVMADEVSHIPGAVATHPSGYLMVDYGVIYG